MWESLLQLRSFVTSSQDGMIFSFTPRQLFLQNIIPITHYTGGWMGPKRWSGQFGFDYTVQNYAMEQNYQFSVTQGPLYKIIFFHCHFYVFCHILECTVIESVFLRTIFYHGHGHRGYCWNSIFCQNRMGWFSYHF
jgi:hypothetical protein